MQISTPAGKDALAKPEGTFSDIIGSGVGAGKSSLQIAALSAPMAQTSVGGLQAPDGRTSDPFPPSLAAYIEVIRSVTAYLREQGLISPIPNEERSIAETAVQPVDVNDVDEPTTFAIGEEEHDCGPPASTPAIGAAADT